MALQSDSISAAARAQAPVPASLTLGLMVLFLVVVFLMTTARLYTRFAIHRKLWWDDWNTLVAFAGTVAEIVTVIILMQHGGGVHYTDVPTADIKAFGLAWEVLEMVARVAILFARLAVLLLYLRSFYPRGVNHSGPWWAIQAIIWLNVLYSVALILVVCLQCTPYGLPFGDTCINEYLLLVLSSTINIISDLAILLIPLALIFKLQMSTRKRWAMWALFAFGSLAPLASAARLFYQVATASSTDKTVVYIIVAILAVAEQVVAIIVGCAPVVASLVIRVARGRTKASSNPSGSRLGRVLGPLSFKRRFDRAPDPFRVTDFTQLEAGESREQFGTKASASDATTTTTTTVRDRGVDTIMDAGAEARESWAMEDYKKSEDEGEHVVPGLAS